MPSASATTRSATAPETSRSPGQLGNALDGDPAPRKLWRRASHLDLTLMGWVCNSQRVMASSVGAADPTQKERIPFRNRCASSRAVTTRPSSNSAAARHAGSVGVASWARSQASRLPA